MSPEQDKKTALRDVLNRFTQDFVRERRPASFQLMIPGIGEVDCTEVFRVISSKRIICLGRTGTRPVIVKIYFANPGAHRHWKRSHRGCSAFLKRGIPAPGILFSGHIPDYGIYVIVFEYLTDAVRVDSALEACPDIHQVERILDALMAFLGSCHEQGILQNDLHLGNFMIKNEMLYALDGDQVKIYRGAIGPKKSLSNLARLLANLPPAYNGGMEDRIMAYVKKRGWFIKDREMVRVKRETRKIRQGILSEYLRKTNKTRDPFLTRWDARFFSVYDRHHFDVVYEEILDTSRHLRHGEGNRLASGYSLIPVGDKEMLAWSSTGYGPRILRRFWSASRIWKNALMLRRIGVETPIPVTLVGRCRNIFRWDCAVFFKPVEGMNLKDFFHSENVASDIKGCIAEALADAYTRMEAFGIIAGRINPEGIIISGLKVVFHDLEIFNRPAFSIWSTQEGRLERFLSYFAHIPGLTELLTEHLKNRGITKVQRS
jgi:hypothetical protein